MNYELLISDGDKVYAPVTVDGIEWVTTRAGAPGKLTFSAVREKDGTPVFHEGARVTLSVDGKNVFCGYVFSRRWDKEGIVSITAYDQLRYFKNKDTYVYSGKTASQVLKMLAADFGMKTKAIADTKYVIPSRVEDNETLFDIVENALDLTLQNTGRMYVLYDDFGAVTLKDISDMYVKDNDEYLFFDESTAENFECSSGIDGNTYNQIKLTRENKKSGRREVFTSRSNENIKRWGVLQLYGKLKNGENGRAKADSLLKLYNNRTRSLRLKNAIGDLRVRAGSMVGVSLGASESKKNEFMLVESARHFFRENEHLMELTLRGGEDNG